MHCKSVNKLLYLSQFFTLSNVKIEYIHTLTLNIFSFITFCKLLSHNLENVLYAFKIDIMCNCLTILKILYSVKFLDKRDIHKCVATEVLFMTRLKDITVTEMSCEY